MKDQNKSEIILRDYLAIDRTKLANQRTMLAYFRTAIMLMASGIGLIKIFGSDFFILILGIILLSISLLVSLLGLSSYIRTKNNIKKLYDIKDKIE
ncbi:DUF202 domain-containing protein [candidate division KSB1 bacterium]|nr:DUF202 domain-containing protein [candidate division KSB1 bacterium]